MNLIIPDIYKIDMYESWVGFTRDYRAIHTKHFAITNLITIKLHLGKSCLIFKLNCYGKCLMYE